MYVIHEAHMSNAPIDSVGIHVFVATVFTIWVVKDSLKRQKLAWGYAILSFLWMWWICLPFYFAGRKLLPGETREGGYGWNVCKFFLLLWSFLLGYCLLGGIMNMSEHVSGREMSDAAAAGAAIGASIGVGMFFCLWIGVAIPTLVIGLLLKKNSVVETGLAEIAPATPPPANSVSVANAGPTTAPQSEVSISVARQGQTIGSFDLKSFKQNVAAGMLLPTDHYWKNGMAAWELIANYRD